MEIKKRTAVTETVIETVTVEDSPEAGAKDLIICDAPVPYGGEVGSPARPSS